LILKSKAPESSLHALRNELRLFEMTYAKKTELAEIEQKTLPVVVE
jgi:hypothetical protein